MLPYLCIQALRESLNKSLSTVQLLPDWAIFTGLSYNFFKYPKYIVDFWGHLNKTF